MVRNKVTVFRCLFLLLLLVACKPRPINFYKDPQYQDLYRIPLIEPIEVANVVDNYWAGSYLYIRDTSSKFLGSIDGFCMDSLTVVDSLIVLFDSGFYVSGTGHVPGWCIISPRQEKYFFCETVDQYKQTLLGFGISELPKLYVPGEVYKRFAQDGILPFSHK
jgi:hypothetical protein